MMAVTPTGSRMSGQVAGANMDQSVTGRAMRSVFLSHSFAERDRQLVTRVESVIRSHGLILLTGRIGAGGNLANDIKHKIDESDALVAVLTHHAPQSGRATNWVESE